MYIYTLAYIAYFVGILISMNSYTIIDIGIPIQLYRYSGHVQSMVPSSTQAHAQAAASGHALCMTLCPLLRVECET